MSTLNESDKRNFYYEYGQYISYSILTHVTLLILISVLTLLGNTLVLAATWKEKSLHEPNKYFVVCLAIADLLVGMFSVPTIVFQRLIERTEEHFPLISGLCHFYIWIDVFAESASIHTLTFISFDRYLKISKPLHYRYRMTTSISVKVILTIFLISTVCSTFSIFPDRGCAPFTKTYFTFLAVAAFFLPIIIMLIMYALIFLVAHKRQKMLRNGELGQTFNDRNVGTAFLRDLKIIRMFVIVIGVFIICWGPLFIWWMLIHYKPELIKRKGKKFVLTMGMIIQLLSLMNSLCNPIIYACLDQKYKVAFKHLFQKLMRRTSQEPPNAMELGNVNQAGNMKTNIMQSRPLQNC